MSTLLRLTFCSLLVLVCAAQTFADATVTKWADKRLPNVAGLALWLDASAQPAAAQAHAATPPKNDDTLEYWYDASGHDRHLRQPDAKMRPAFRLNGDRGTVRFSGNNVYFALNTPGIAFDDVTIFLVTAPLRNQGTFRGLLSMHAEGEDDFRSGLNIDLGVNPSTKFDVVNVETIGTLGMQNLRTSEDPLGAFHQLCVATSMGTQNIALYVDGQPEGVRTRSGAPMRMDELIVGGRHWGGMQARGFFAGEIAEVLIYDRTLPEEERKAIEAYLAAKYKAIAPPPPLIEAALPGSIARVATPPVVQMLVPGFAVHELPVKLPNVNNVLYRNDGKLVALGYDGNIHLLSDTDGDGLENKADLFYENKGQVIAPIGMCLTPPGYEHGNGVAVAAKGKCVLIVDTDGDDHADKEIVVASGWPESAHPVDALGVAFDPRDHAICFGLGTSLFSDPYVLKGGTKPGYDLAGERGTILRIAPDLKSREVVATGIRFPVAVRFNAAGDLFCTDQEGATWLPNGNPFDELLNVEKGRHYGFPPRHPRYLPNVIDEPSVFDYRPQHQSTCGLNFNDPAADSTAFGPAWWRSDAIVTGYSRGKLYRTKLAKTANGYVAKSQLLASLAVMPPDACVAPGGSLVIAAHSGGPDWGNGPNGIGRLFKVSTDKQDVPRPSLVWAAGPQEVRIAFDQPVDPKSLKGLASRIAIEGGEYVAAGDRLETVRPGYAVVEHQQSAPRLPVDIENLQLTADGRTLIISTTPQLASVNYAVAMRGVPAASEATTATTEVAQLPDVDLQYDLTGVEAKWTSQGSGEESVGWLPHIDLDVSRAFTTASNWHDAFWKQTEQPGTLELRTQLDLRSMLRPAVQVGAKLDFDLPAEQVTLLFESNCAFEVTFEDKNAAAAERETGKWQLELPLKGTSDKLQPLGVRLNTQPDQVPPQLTLAYRTQEDSRARALQLTRLLLPWARPSTYTPEIKDNNSLPELAGGNWLRGRKEFFGNDAGCFKCHTTRGEGGAVGPDLSNLPKRDYASVVRDITLPSFAINPDFVAQTIVTTDGHVLTGTVRTKDDQLVISDQQGKETILARSDVDEFHLSDKSIMPEGIPRTLGPERMRDLLTFLLVEPPHMPVYGEAPPPPPTPLHDVEAVFAGPKTTTSPRPLNIVLVAGPKDHGLGEHDYPAWLATWRSLFQMDEAVKVLTANPWPSTDDWKSADVMVFYQQGSWTPERARDVDAFLKRGGGLVYIHFAVDGGADPAGFAERIGLAWQTGKSKFRHGELDLEFAPGSNSPITRNLSRIHLHDESYWELVGDARRVNLLATGSEDNRPQPLMWTYEPKLGGRVFVSIPGHFSWTFDDPIFRTLVLRGIAWTANEPVDRFNDLVLPGSRIAKNANTNAAASPQAE